MSDLLSAQSILLAVLTALAGLWHDRFIEFDKLRPTGYRDDYQATLEKLARVRRHYAGPLAVYALLMSLMAMPTGIEIVTQALALLSQKGLAARHDYDAVRATYLAVLAVLCGFLVLSWYLGGVYRGLSRKLREIRALPRRSSSG